MNLYDDIEEPVRGLVKLLRDNGFNTTSSCGHKQWVQMEWYIHQDINRLCKLLVGNGYQNFELHLIWPSTAIGRFMEIRIIE